MMIALTIVIIAIRIVIATRNRPRYQKMIVAIRILPFGVFAIHNDDNHLKTLSY